MEGHVLSNEFIEIMKDETCYYLRSKKSGMSIDAFNKLLITRLPMVKITSFLSIKNVLTNAPGGPLPFGVERERVNLSITDDALKAYITLYVPDEDLGANKRVELVREVFDVLQKAGIVFGIKTAVLAGPLVAGNEYLVAEGLAPTHGLDATVKMYEISKPSPQIVDNGSANYYELNLIQRVDAGDWLGERIDPLPGMPGKNIRGKEIAAINGKMLPLFYDRLSVREQKEEGRTVLYSKKTGAVYMKGDTIGVYDYLEIKGDVNYTTGNVDFDGYLSVKGTVEDSFSVIANKDVEILGEYGVGGAEQILSREGNIYIKGGIAGMGKAIIRCKKNLYVKFLSDVTVECEGNVYVGFYCINAHIRAKQVIVESPKGRIIGGTIDADVRVEVAEIGNRAENRTVVRIRGFDRQEMKIRLEQIVAEMEELRNRLARVKQILQVYSGNHDLNDEQKRNQENARIEYEELKDKMKDVEFEFKSFTEYMRTPGEGAVIIKKRGYPKVRIEIKNVTEENSQEHLSRTYLYREGQLITQ